MGLDRAVTEAGDGAHERLGPAELEREDLLAVSHVHRYELAAELCEGARVLDLCCGTGYGARILAARARSVHGVDIAAEAIDVARAALTPDESERITFEQADALAHLRSLPADRFDAVVCFEGIEHVPDPDALLDELVRLGGGGARLFVSLPNSRGFDEENEFHVTDYGYEEMRAAAERLGGALVVEQHLAEASVLLPAGAEDELELRGRLRGSGRDEAAWANHWLLLTGADAATVEGARARLSIAATSNQNGYMRLLERANADLRRHNARLARRWLGLHDAAAASVIRGLEERRDAAAASATHWEGEARKWEKIADNNDWAFKNAQLELARPRYRATAAVFDTLFAVPGVSAARRGLKAIRRSSRG